MQQIGTLWNKFPRIVRDVAAACGKKVRIEMEGHETELDKTVLEAIKDPPSASPPERPRRAASSCGPFTRAAR